MMSLRMNILRILMIVFIPLVSAHGDTVVCEDASKNIVADSLCASPKPVAATFCAAPPQSACTCPGGGACTTASYCDQGLPTPPSGTECASGSFSLASNASCWAWQANAVKCGTNDKGRGYTEYSCSAASAAPVTLSGFGIARSGGGKNGRISIAANDPGNPLAACVSGSGYPTTTNACGLSGMCVSAPQPGPDPTGTVCGASFNNVASVNGDGPTTRGFIFTNLTPPCPSTITICP